MATTDTTATIEHETLTERCGLVDRSERGKLALTGAGAVEFLNGQITNELVGLKPGEGCYAAFLTHKGKMLGDLRVLVVEGDSGSAQPKEMETDVTPEGQRPVDLLLDTERVALQALFDTIRRFKVGYEVELHKRTLECSLLSLIGPDADEVVARAFALATAAPHARARARAVVLPEREHQHLLAHLDAVPVRLIRTDVGIDALFDSSALDFVRRALESAGASAVGESAAEIVRVEHGRPRYGLDMDDRTIPQEAGLNERAVSFTKGCYVGQETVARLYYKGKPNRHLRGLRLSEPVERGAELLADRRSRRSTIGGDRSVGHLGSSVLSPTFGPIGLALVRREAEPGMTVTLGDTGIAATVVELPFQ